MKKKKVRRNPNEAILNLRQISFDNHLQSQGEIELVLDKFIAPLLQRQGISAKIIVGKGMNSSTFIDGKHPLRYYTECYLSKLGLYWKNGFLTEGKEGVIVVGFE